MYSWTTSGWSRPSSQSSASRSAKTISAIAPRSTSPFSAKTASPKRSFSASRTDSSSCSRRWTMSSLEMTAAPWRAKAARASLLPAPMPPVMATAIGLAKLLGLVCGSLGLGGRLRLLGRLFGRFRDRLLGGLFFACCLVRLRLLGGLELRLRLGLRLVQRRCLGSCRALREDLLREIEVRRALDDLGVLGALGHTSALDPLERQREATAFGVHLDDLRLDRVALRDDLPRVLDVMLRELGDVNEPLDARHDLDEGAESDDLGDLALDLVALVVGLEHLLPGIALGLLEAERDALALAVDVEHLDLHVLADLEHLGRMVDVAPGELGDMNQAVHPVEVDEGAEVDDVRDLAVDDVARVEPVEDRLPHLLALVLEHGPAREHDVIARAVELDHLRAQLLAEKLVEVLHAADVDQGGGQEAAHAEVEDQAALDDLDHPAEHGLLRLGRSLDRLPGHLEAGALLRQDQAALGVLFRQHERVDLVAERDLVRGAHRAPDRELGDRDHALRLVADVDEHLVLVDAHDSAVDDLPLVDRRECGVVVRDALAVLRRRPDGVLVELRTLSVHGLTGHREVGQYSREALHAWVPACWPRTVCPPVG